MDLLLFDDSFGLMLLYEEGQIQFVAECSSEGGYLSGFAGVITRDGGMIEGHVENGVPVGLWLEMQKESVKSTLTLNTISLPVAAKQDIKSLCNLKPGIGERRQWSNGVTSYIGDLPDGRIFTISKLNGRMKSVNIDVFGREGESLQLSWEVRSGIEYLSEIGVFSEGMREGLWVFYTKVNRTFWVERIKYERGKPSQWSEEVLPMR